ncbi:MAG: E3 binding domain-containing protein, partial [Opitutaceae bacterium]|nr:E3 binding domain-containing protein [Opitutaceae bacterium]
MMALEVKIPPMGESINSGVLAKWHVKDGDLVKKDQPLFELETDKITSEGVAEAAGKITFKVAAGTEVKIGAVVATIDDSATAGASAPAAPPVTSAPVAAKEGASTAISPAVRRLAAETGIDPASVSGSGKDGRVTKGDMLAVSTTQTPAPSPAAPVVAAASVPTPQPTLATPQPAAERQTRRKLSPLRKRIAERLVQAQHEAAMLTTFNEVDMSAVMELRK